MTAQLREQSLQDVPIAMQVVDRALIEDVAAEDMGDLNGFVPGLVVSGDSPTQPRYQIRGIQTGDFGVGTDPAVGVYVDGVYSARSGASLLAFNDIERIEVLKGRRARCSAATAPPARSRSSPRKPSRRIRCRCCVCASATFGKQYFEGMINTPIGDTVALRVNGALQQERRLAAGCRHRQATRRRGELGGTRGAALGPRRRDAVRRSRWDHDELDQLARPAIGIVPLAAGSGAGCPTRPIRRPTSIRARRRSTTTSSATRNRASSTA